MSAPRYPGALVRFRRLRPHETVYRALGPTWLMRGRNAPKQVRPYQSGRVLKDLGDRVRVQRFLQSDGTAPVLVWPKAGLRWSPDPRLVR